MAPGLGTFQASWRLKQRLAPADRYGMDWDDVLGAFITGVLNLLRPGLLPASPLSPDSSGCCS